jgi:uncharacterized protein (TIGR02611 family)
VHSPTNVPTKQRPGWFRRMRQQIRHRPALHVTWRVVVLVLGWLIIMTGIALLILPGPGWAIIFLGLAILATEFVWARHLLMWAHDRFRRYTDLALDPRVRRRNQLILLIALVVCGVTVGLYLWRFGVPDVLERVFPPS